MRTFLTFVVAGIAIAFMIALLTVQIKGFKAQAVNDKVQELQSLMIANGVGEVVLENNSTTQTSFRIIPRREIETNLRKALTPNEVQ